MDTDVTLPGTTTPTKQTTGSVDWQGVAWFVALTFLITWGFWISTYFLKVPFTLRASIGMFVPALVCLLVRLIRREGFADAGLRLAGKGIHGAWKFYLAAYFVPTILIIVGVALAIVTGLQPYDLPPTFSIFSTAPITSWLQP